MQAVAHASITSLCRSSHGLHRVTHCKDVNHTAAGFSAVIFVRIFRSGLKEVEELQFDPKDVANLSLPDHSFHKHCLAFQKF
uniref:Uncharacterized protein n=1 Tax=Triticum urartu TaxID=4572 RepID=A0A8R7V9M2_TRIUA